MGLYNMLFGEPPAQKWDALFASLKAEATK